MMFLSGWHKQSTEQVRALFMYKTRTSEFFMAQSQNNTLILFIDEHEFLFAAYRMVPHKPQVSFLTKNVRKK